LGDDAAAISTVLSARALAPTARLIARANEVSSEAKLLRAGCDKVVNPLSQGAQQIAAFAHRPAVADFLETVHDQTDALRLEEVRLTSESPVAGVTLGDAHIRARTGALVVALRRHDGRLEPNPDADVVLTPGTTLVVIGTDEELASLDGVLGPVL
jgi:voltage-gated potassium channel